MISSSPTPLELVDVEIQAQVNQRMEFSWQQQLI